MSAFDTFATFREKMPVQVEVSSHFIRTGQRSSCHHCPLAQALFAATGEQWSVHLSECCHFTTGYTIKLPDVAIAWRHRFDHAAEVEPFAFNLDIPLALLSLEVLPTRKIS